MITEIREKKTNMKKKYKYENINIFLLDIRVLLMNRMIVSKKIISSC